LKCLRDERHSPASIAVLVRTKNERSSLPDFWRSLASQSIFADTEIIFLDSGSTDGTIEYLSDKPCAIYSIPSHEFHFGSSCNQIAAYSTAPILAYFSAHVVLNSATTLATLVDTLSNETFAAAYMRQVPKPLSASAYDRAFLARRFPSRRRQPVRMSSPGGFSNAASAMTRASWDRLPFKNVEASEDCLWATEHLRLGGKLYYLPQLTIQHSHNERPEAVYSRVRLNMQARASRGSLLKSLVYSVAIFVALLRQGASLREASMYAAAHGRAYR
jgi:GT2 family glycosyltransferase